MWQLVSQVHHLQPRRDDQMSYSDRRSQHPASHQNSQIIILPKELHQAETLHNPGNLSLIGL